MSKSDDLKNRLDEIFSSIPAPSVLESELELPPKPVAPAPVAPAMPMAPVSEPEVVAMEEAAFETAFEHASVGIVMASNDGMLLRVNDAFCNMLGYGRAQLEGNYLKTFTYEEDLHIGSDEIQDLIAGKIKTTQFHKRYCHKNGSLVWFEFNTSILHDESGNPSTLVAIVQDITAQHQTADLLQKRVRELDCLTDIGHRIDEKPPLPEFFKWVAERAPIAFQDPENCVAAIEYDGHVFGDKRALQMKSKSVAGIRRAGELVGWLHIAYTKHRDFADAESRLMGGIASRISSYIESQTLPDETRVAFADRKLTETQVEKRASQLATVAKLSARVAETLNTNELLQTVVDLTKENFGLYHAHIYLVDDSNENLVLTAGALEVGRKMVAQGWKIPVSSEQSLVARSAREHQGVIVNDVREDPGFLPNDLLPATRSEMAIPVMVGPQVLGVLDVQSAEAGFFSQEDINIMTALASQVAVALQNARRFEAVQSSESLIRSIIDSTPDWIFVKDRQHRMVLTNLSFAAAMGKTPDEFIGKTDLEVGFPEETVMGDAEKGIKGYWWDDQHVLDTGEPQLIKGEPNVVDDKQLFFDVYKVPLYDATGNIWGLLGFARDITERQQLLDEVSQNAQSLVTLNDMSRSLAAASDLDSVVKVTYDYSSRFMDTTNFFVALYNQETNGISFPICYLDGVSEEIPARQLGVQSMTDYIINHHQPLLLSEDVLDGMEKLGIAFVPLGDDEVSVSWLGVPMMFGDEIIGVIAVQSTTTPGLYTEREKELLMSIANQASSAFRLVQQFDDTRKALEASESLYTGSARILGAADAQETLSVLVEATVLSQFDHSSIMFFDTPWQDVMPTYGTLTAAVEKSGEFPVGSLGLVSNLAEIPFTSLIQRDEPVFIPDVNAEDRLDPVNRSFIKGSLALFPLAVGDNWFGWVASMADHPIAIPNEDLRRISSLIDQAAIVLQSQRLEQSMQERLHELTALQRLMSREAWSTYQTTTASGTVGYLFDQVNLNPMTSEMLPVLGNGGGAGDETGLAPHRSAFSTTLSVQGEPIGALGIAQEATQTLSPQDEEFLRAISDQVSQALERARLMEQTQRSAVELQAVAEVSTATSTILEPQSLLQRVVDLTKDRFGLYHAHIYLLEDAENNLVLTAGAGTIGQSMVLEGWSIPFDKEDSIVARTAQTRQGQIVADVEKEPGFLRNPLLPDTRSELAVPIIVADTLLGVFDAQSNVVNRFTIDDIRTYSTLAAQMGIALQNAKLYAEQLDTVERLRELDNMKSAFLANMSHELRTPLNSILGFTQVIIEGLDGPVTETMTSDLELVEKNGQHLLHLINDVSGYGQDRSRSLDAQSRADEYVRSA